LALLLRVPLSFRCLGTRRGPLVPCFVAKLRHGCLDGFFQTNVIPAALEVWHQGLLGDLFGIGIAEVRFQAVGDAERVGPFIRSPQQHDAVVPAGLANFPKIRKVDGICSHGLPAETVNDDHDELDRSLLLVVLEQTG